MIDEKDKCPSCDKFYIEHLGIIGTCAELIAAQARLDEAVLLLAEARITIQYSGLFTVEQSASVTDKIRAFLAEGGE
jgi:hypothetical protein